MDQVKKPLFLNQDLVTLNRLLAYATYDGSVLAMVRGKAVLTSTGYEVNT
jgi:hypothetical protein